VIKPKSRFFEHSTKHWQRADANYFTVDSVSANFGVTAYIASAILAYSPYLRLSGFRLRPDLLAARL
jgi:hypothetical protein